MHTKVTSIAMVLTMPASSSERDNANTISGCAYEVSAPASRSVVSAVIHDAYLR